MIKQIVAYIDATTKTFEVKQVEDEKIVGPLSFGYAEYKIQKEFLCFGTGLLAGSSIPGAKRLIFCGYSPLWENFYISTMGGAALILQKTGLNYVLIKGRAEKLSVMKINRINGELKIVFETIEDIDNIWKDYKGKHGTYALQEYVYDKYASEYTTCRILCVGPAAKYTNCGAIMSAPIEKGIITPVDCWAGRGGIGSNMFQTHNIAAIIYGGDYVDENKSLTDMVKINALFQKHFQKNMIQADMEHTVKYRFDPTLNSGGTLGANFTSLKGWMFSFNYKSIYWTEEERIRIHKEYVLNHYLKQFNEETIVKKQFKHCGEPCVAVCKKMNGEFKKDYEPYQTFGPNCGIFDQRDAENCNHLADSMGFDTIQSGMIVSWIMDLIASKKIPKEDFDLKGEPKFDANNFDVVNDSKNNGNLALEILNMILYNEKGKIFRLGIRDAAKEIDKRYNIDSINYAVFNAYAKHGCMVPNQYWVPGMFSPMPIMGKYFEYYSVDFKAPRELGKLDAERMIKEFTIDNCGMCRFHRGWAEKIVGEIVNELYGTNYDFLAIAKEIAKDLEKDNKSVFWETARVIDIIKIYLDKMLTGDPNNETLKMWIKKFNDNKIEAAKEYWNEIKLGIYDALEN
ncbi:MAG: aldehyde ferredoxin oxidoreductase N-terminal domain-containing protein [Candidatus Woesearchaeota archaeon]|jgi:glyceraldehyde-3-phosphate dehydrogenase (ferredoxin)